MSYRLIGLPNDANECALVDHCFAASGWHVAHGSTSDSIVPSLTSGLGPLRSIVTRLGPSSPGVRGNRGSSLATGGCVTCSITGGAIVASPPQAARSPNPIVETSRWRIGFLVQRLRNRRGLHHHAMPSSTSNPLESEAIPPWQPQPFFGLGSSTSGAGAGFFGV